MLEKLKSLFKIIIKHIFKVHLIVVLKKKINFFNILIILLFKYYKYYKYFLKSFSNALLVSIN